MHRSSSNMLICYLTFILQLIFVEFALKLLVVFIVVVVVDDDVVV